MVPTFQNNSTVLVNRFAYIFKNPQIFDIIALIDPRDGKILIKRIQKIENNTYFVTGDNTNASTDSRKFGMIEKKSIIGKVFL